MGSLALPFAGVVSTGGIGFEVTNSGAGFPSVAVAGKDSGLGGIGVQGIGTSFGIFGQSQSGEAVHGQSVGGIGLNGESENSAGVRGGSTRGDGVYAETLQGSNGLHAKSSHSGGSGVWGENAGGGYGVSGSTNSGFVPGSGVTAGVWGDNAGSGAGVKGTSAGGDAVIGLTRSSAHAGVSAVNDSGGFGVWARGAPAGHFENDSGNIGTAGVEVSSNGPAGVGVAAANTTDTGTGVVGSGFVGVRGTCIFAQSHGTVGFGVGVHGEQATDSNGTLLPGTAGWFDGDVWISRNLKVVGDLSNFTIDHPLDPANKYLNHRYVESSERKNIYDGIVSLNQQGEANVLLPAWFDALNQDFRYQLTCIGGYGPVYVAQEIKNGVFKIAGGKPGMQVSWQVTGVRHDPWARQNPILIEEDKSADEKGYYLNAEAYNQPREKSIGWLKGPSRIYPLKPEKA